MSKQSTPVRLAGLALILASLTLGGAPPLARAADAGLAPNGPASVTEFYVDRSDDANANACTSANPNDCTLRGAINRVNTDGVLNATIRFSDTISQIDLTTELPTLTTPGTYILGGF